MRLKYRISAGEGSQHEHGLTTPQLLVELAGPDVPLVVQHNGELLRALRQRGLTPMNILSAELPVEA